MIGRSQNRLIYNRSTTRAGFVMIMLVTNDISHIFNMLLTYLTRRGLKIVVIL